MHQKPKPACDLFCLDDGYWDTKWFRLYYYISCILNETSDNFIYALNDWWKIIDISATCLSTRSFSVCGTETQIFQFKVRIYDKSAKNGFLRYPEQPVRYGKLQRSIHVKSLHIPYHKLNTKTHRFLWLDCTSHVYFTMLWLLMQ